MILKSTIMLAICATMALAQGSNYVAVFNNKGVRREFYIFEGYRYCYCLKNTQSNKIYHNNAGDVKLFSTNDCTGNYAQLGKGKTQINAQWVNSFSMGKSGIASLGPDGCPNYF